MFKMRADKLRQLRIELTRRCNLHCRDCYTLQFHEIGEELSAGKIFNLIDGAIPLGLETVSITGGEPLLEYKKLVEVLRYSKSRELKTGLLTNSTLATSEVVEELKGIGLDWVRLSLDGSNPDINAITRRDSFYSALRGIKRFAESGVYAVLRTTVHRGNSEDIGGMIELAIGLRIPRIEFQPYILLAREDLNSQFSLPIEAQEMLALSLIALKQKYKGALDIGLLSGWFEFLSPNYTPGISSQEGCYCLHADDSHVNALHIDSLGNIRTCGCNTAVLGNIRANSVEEIFLGSPYLNDLRNYDASRYCPKCSKANLCFPCPAPRTNVYGTVNAPAPDCPKVRRGENR